MSHSESATLKFFLSDSEQYVMHSMKFSPYFSCFGCCACMDPAMDGTRPFVPLRNKFLATVVVGSTIFGGVYGVSNSTSNPLMLQSSNRIWPMQLLDGTN